MVSLKPILRGRGQLALQCACGGWGEARRRHEPKLHVKANEERRFEPRSVDYLGMELSDEPRVLSVLPQSGLADMHHRLTFLQILNRAASSEVGKWLTARSRLSSYSACATLPPGEFAGRRLQCPPVATLPAHLAMPGRVPVPAPHARQRGGAVCAASSLGGRRRRID